MFFFPLTLTVIVSTISFFCLLLNLHTIRNIFLYIEKEKFLLSGLIIGKTRLAHIQGILLLMSHVYHLNCSPISTKIIFIILLVAIDHNEETGFCTTQNGHVLFFLNNSEYIFFNFSKKHF